MPIPHRRIFLAGCGAAGIVALARTGRSAEIEAHTNPRTPGRRPRADFEAAKVLAEAVNTPAAVEAIMRDELGPLPWHFDADAEHPEWLDVTQLARMSEPEAPGEATGVWAICRVTNPANPELGSRLMLMQLGRLALTIGKRTEIMIHGWQLADYHASVGGFGQHYEAPAIWFEHVPEEPRMLHKITFTSKAYRDAMDALIEEIARAAIA